MDFHPLHVFTPRRKDSELFSGEPVSFPRTHRLPGGPEGPLVLPAAGPPGNAIPPLLLRREVLLCE